MPEQKAGECVTSVVGNVPGYRACPAELLERGMWGYWGKISRIAYAKTNGGDGYVDIFYEKSQPSTGQSLDIPIWVGSEPPATFKMHESVRSDHGQNRS